MTEDIQNATIGEEHEGRRFDQALAALFPDYSRSRLKQWILEGKATLDGEQVAPRAKVRAGQQVAVQAQPTAATGSAPEAIALDIVHEDDEVLVVNKPAGLVVHPGAGNATGTLENGLLHHAPELVQLPRAGLIHRIDKDTTGLLVVAKTLPAHTHLVRELEKRRFRREYRAVCVGVLTAGGTIDEPIGRHTSQRTRMAIHYNGRHAVTHYRVIERFAAHTYLAARLETGRTHQIRVHMAHLRHALVGDPVYGGRLALPEGADEALIDTLRQFRRQALHAALLGFEHPGSGEFMEFRAPLPADFGQLLEVLGYQDRGSESELVWPEADDGEDEEGWDEDDW